MPCRLPLIALAALLAAAASTSPRLTAAPEDTGGSTARRADIAESGNETKGFDMAPETNQKVVEKAVAAIPDKLPAGPFEPTWDSLKSHYKVPAWFADAKFGLFMHFGLYSVPAHGNEWYEKHMYSGGGLQWHIEHFGNPEVFGYKDFIPKFTCEHFDANAWALLFKKSGAKYVVPTAQHHENFSMWDSQVNPINAAKMGPKQDIIGELAVAIRKQGLKFGVSNHGIEAFQFVNPDKALAADLKAKQKDIYDPEWANWYNVADRSDDACQKFLTNWAQRNVELVDKYQPDMLWFDNGVDMRYLDPIKLWVAAYYYNRAAEWGKEVSISTKKAAYAPDGTNIHTIGSIIDFEKIGGRSPAAVRTGAWQVDQPIGSTWGYTEGMHVSAPGNIINALADTVSKNGNLLLNLSPKSDGTIPDEQQKTLLAVGEWLTTNGEAIYGTHNWTKFSDGQPKGGLNIRFTVKGDALYAIVLDNKPGAEATINSLGTSAGTIKAVSLLGGSAPLKFTQEANGLKVSLPQIAPGGYAYVLKIEGLKTNPSANTADGNPQ